MRRLLIVLRRDYREMIASTAFRIVVIVTGVIVVGASAGVTIGLRLQDWYGDPETQFVAPFIIGLVLYFLSLLVLLVFTWGFSSLQITKEKVNGNIECLLATPMSPKNLWIGKVLAIFLPGYGIALVSVCIVWVAINIFAVLPGWSTFAIPQAVLFVSLVSNPILFSAVMAYSILVSLSGNPDVAITPAFLIGFGLMIGIPAGLVSGVIDMMSWSFALWYTGGAVLAWLVVAVMMRSLKRQTIVLSSKGG